MKTISMRMSAGHELAGRKLALGLATLAAMGGIGYVFWRLLDGVQSWAASTAWATQIIQ